MVGKFLRYFKSEVCPIPTRMLAVIGLILLLILPFFASQPHILRLLIMVNIYAIFAASWDLISVYTGQLVLGHALFFGTAAYTCALLNTILGWPPWATIFIGTFVAVLTGLVAGVPALRLKGLYLGLTTLAMPIVLSGIIVAFRGFTGGEQGIIGVELLVTNRVIYYYITLLIMIASVVILMRITRSKVGLIFQAIRDDELTAKASGVNTTFFKLLSFTVSGLFAGLSGGLYAHFIRVIGPSVLDFNFSFMPIIWTVFGGGASIVGPVLGVFILVPVVEMLRTYLGENATLVYYFILIAAVVFASGGILRWITRHLDKPCPICSTVNAFTRRQCRSCSAKLDSTDSTEAETYISAKGGS